MTPAPRAAHAAPTARTPWLDTARGLAILLVALYHATLYAEFASVRVGVWSVVNEILRSARMPLFFLVSGLLIVRALQRPWAELWRSKFSTWIWLYLVWAGVTLAVALVVTLPRTDPAGSRWSDVPGLVTDPQNGLWYLYALAVFLLVVRATRSWPAPVVVLAAAVPLLLFGDRLVSTGNFAFDSMGRFVFFFVLGARLPEVVRWYAERQPRARHVAVMGLFAVTALVLVVVTRLAGGSVLDALALPLVRPVLAVVAAAAGVAFAVVVTPMLLGRGLAHLGRQTLRIYLAHELLMGLLAAGLIAAALPRTTAVGLVLPVVLVVVVVPATLVLHRLLARVPGVYAAPAWSRGWRTTASLHSPESGPAVREDRRGSA